MKIEQKNIFFHELNIDEISGMTVILDIDGTLTCSSQKNVSQRVIKIIRLLEQKNAVYAFSNNYNGHRSREIAKNINVPYIESPHKKPNKKVLNYIDGEVYDVVAIGDKYLTDGLFAQSIGAKHIKVYRYRCSSDSVADKLACLLDDLVYFCVKYLGIVK
jgi:predicted HAD superfamily phosphohydrolase YqeG